MSVGVVHQTESPLVRACMPLNESCSVNVVHLIR